MTSIWDKIAEAANEEAERYSKIAEVAEMYARIIEAGAEGGSSVGDCDETKDDEPTAWLQQHDPGRVVSGFEPPDTEYCGAVSEFTFSDETANVREGIDVAEEIGTVTYEGEFSIEPGAESNVEEWAPSWYHEDEGEPDGHVACPSCAFYPLSYTVTGARNESARLELDCPYCEWESETYSGKMAIGALSLIDRARNIQSTLP